MNDTVLYQAIKDGSGFVTQEPEQRINTLAALTLLAIAAQSTDSTANRLVAISQRLYNTKAVSPSEKTDVPKDPFNV